MDSKVTPMSRCSRSLKTLTPLMKGLQVATSFLDITTWCASRIPAAKSTEKGVDDKFSRNSKTYQAKNLCTIQVSFQKLPQYHFNADANTTNANTTKSCLNLEAFRKVQVTKPLMTVEKQLENEVRNVKPPQDPKQSRGLLFHPWLYRYSSWKRQT